MNGRLVEAKSRWAGMESHMGAEHLQANQPPAQPAVHHCGYNVLITISTPEPWLCQLLIIMQKQTLFTDITLVM